MSFLLLGPPSLVQAISPEDTGLQDTAGAAGFGSTAPSLTGVVAGIINAVLGIVGLVFVVLLIYGGITWMTAMGNTETVKKARATIVNSLIGLVIVAAAYAIASYVVPALVQAVSGSGTAG